MAADVLLSFMAPMVSVAVGGVSGGLAHGFARRWPRSRSVGPSRAALVAIGAALALALTYGGPTGQGAIVPAVLVALLLPITLVDLELRLIPDVLTLPGTAICLAVSVALGGQAVVVLVWTCVSAGVFALPAVVAPGSVGWGDVKLAALLGASLGGGAIWALALALLVAGGWAVAALIRSGRAARELTIPLAPSLTTGALCVLLLG